MVVDNRRRYLLRHVDVATKKGLEIGPYLQPTVRKDEGDIRYLDFYSTEELAAREQERRAKGTVIPTVDYVVKSDDYYRHVPDRFDYVIANHVIEHTDNPLQWLNDLAQLLRDGGVMFLTIPDKKYNFDRYRSDTPLSHLLTDYFRGHGEPMEHGVDIELNYDTAYVGKPIDLSRKLDAERLRAAAHEPSHPGRHNHVFQSETFVARILRPLQRMRIWPYTLLEFGPAPENSGEFYLVLRLGQEDVKVSLQDVYGPAARAAEPDAAAQDEFAGMSPDDLRAEVLRLRAELGTLRNSLSWRLTRPVRRILDAFR